MRHCHGRKGRLAQVVRNLRHRRIDRPRPEAIAAESRPAAGTLIPLRRALAFGAPASRRVGRGGARFGGAFRVPEGDGGASGTMSFLVRTHRRNRFAPDLDMGLGFGGAGAMRCGAAAGPPCKPATGGSSTILASIGLSSGWRRRLLEHQGEGEQYGGPDGDR